MIKDIVRDMEDKMKKAVEHFRRELGAVRAGRASPALLEKVLVDYYGTPTPVNQLASISAPEPRLLVIQPWDKSVLPNIEKAILKSDLGLTPTSDGSVIRLALPQLTEERRKELVKHVRKMAEEQKVAVRNIRRDAIDEIKAREKNGELSEDDARRGQDEVQKVTDRYVKEIDGLLEAKEKEILTV